MNPTTRSHVPASRLAFGAIAALVLLTRPLLPALPLTHLDRLGPFLQHNGAVVTAAAGLRIIATVAAGYVLVIAMLALLVAIGRPSPGIARLVRAVTVPALRFALPSALGLCLMAVPAGARTAPGLDHRASRATRDSASVHAPPTTAVGTPHAGPSSDDLVLLEAPQAAAPIPRSDDPGTTKPSVAGAAGPDDVATFRVEPTDQTSNGTSSTTASAVAPPRSAPARRPAPRRRTAPRTTRTRNRRQSVPGKSGNSSPATASTAHRAAETTSSAVTDHTHGASPYEVTSAIAPPAVAVTPPTARSTDASAQVHGAAPNWTVRPGDHLWRIAHDTTSARLGRPATEAEVAPYWKQLIETNRPRLVDPNNPDLIFPGQVFVLP